MIINIYFFGHFCSWGGGGGGGDVTMEFNFDFGVISRSMFSNIIPSAPTGIKKFKVPYFGGFAVKFAFSFKSLGIEKINFSPKGARTVKLLKTFLSGHLQNTVAVKEVTAIRSQPPFFACSKHTSIESVVAIWKQKHDTRVFTSSSAAFKIST